jgi:peptidoglycan/xylan/chitin deacetylase (PgdA/CDA1 family)
MKGKRELLAQALCAPIVSPVVRRLARRPNLLCLTYHRIADLDDFDPGVISASLAELDWQAGWLRRHARVLSGAEVLAVVRGERPLTGPAVCLTFDDGYADNLEAARLLSVRHGLQAIFFLTTGLVGTDNITDWDRLAYAVQRSRRRHLHVAAVDGHGPWALDLADRARAVQEVKRTWRRLPVALQPRFIAQVEAAAERSAGDDRVPRLFLTWDEARELLRLGHTIGGHTHTHPILATVPPEAQRDELSRSRQILSRELGGAAEIVQLAYPVGKRDSFTAETKRLAREAGFLCAYSFYGGSNVPGRLDPYDLRREAVENDMSRALFQARASCAALGPI